MKLRHALFVFCLIPTLGWAEFQQTYTDDFYQFQISLPTSEWSFVDIANPNDVKNLVKVKMTFAHAVDQFVPNITLSLYQTKPETKLDLEQALQESLRAYPTQLKLLQKKKLALHQLQGFDVVLWDEETHLKFRQCFVLAQKRIFILTYTARVWSFERYQKDFEKVLHSFKILERI